VVSVAGSERVMVACGDSEADALLDARADGESLALGDADALPEADGLCRADADVETQTEVVEFEDSDCVADAVEDGSAVELTDVAAVGEALPCEDADALPEKEGLPLADPVEESLNDVVATAVGVGDAEEESEGPDEKLTDVTAVSEALPYDDADTLPEKDGLPLADTVDESQNDVVAMAVGDGKAEEESDGADEKLTDATAVSEALAYDDAETLLE